MPDEHRPPRLACEHSIQSLHSDLQRTTATLGGARRTQDQLHRQSVTVSSKRRADADPLLRLRSPSQHGKPRGPRLQVGHRADRRGRLALRARLRDDRRATQPPSTDDLESPSNWAGVAITARTQGTLSEHCVACEMPGSCSGLAGETAS
jgi:hypothetical protein